MFAAGVIYQIAKEFISLTLSVIPYFILGAVFGALIEVYVKHGFVYRYLNHGTGSVINASILGAVLPGCSCATIPMAEGLKEKGASLGTVVSFIMVSPLLSPHTVFLTYAMLGLRFTIARIFFSLSGAIILGLLFNYFENKKIKGFASAGKSAACCARCPPACEAEKLTFGRSLIRITKDLGKYFILGMFIASLLTMVIPEEAIPKYIGSSGAFAYLAAVLVGIPVYICEGEEIPLTRALLKLGLGQGPSFSFLLGSVGTCIPTMLMAQKIIGKRATAVYIIYWLIFAIAAGLLFRLFF